MKYSKEHVWVKEEGEVIVVGVTDYAQEKLSDVAFVQLPKVGDVVENGKSFATIESVKTVSDMFAPVNGEIVEVNEKLTDAPELINKEPTGEGWIAKIKVKDAKELDTLMSADDYEKFVK